MKRIVASMLVITLYAPAAWTGTTSMTSTQTTQAQTESVDQINSRYWGLSVDDYRRSQSLMRGIRGSISDPRITPIEVLGIHAKNDAERRKFAEMFARLMAEDAARVLAFQDDYQQAFARLYPNLRAIDLQNPKRLPSPQKTLASIPSIPTTGIKAFASQSRMLNTSAMSQPSKLAVGDRILLFAIPGCANCGALMQRATAMANAGMTVDVFVVGANNESDVQRYAQSVGVDPGLVRRGAITLNLDQGTFARVLPWKPDLPQVVRKRGDTLQQLLTSDL